MATTDTTVDMWQTESGLPSDFDGEVTDAGFMLDEKYDRIIIDLEIQSDDPDVGDDGIVTLKLGIGGSDKWEIVGRGDTVQHASGRVKRFNTQSAYGVFLSRAVELAGEGLRDKGEPTVAAIWKGSRWHFDREEFTIKDRDTGLDVKRDRLLPTAFLGFKGQPKKATAKKAASKPDAKATAAKPAKVEPPAEVDERLVALAKEVKDAGGNVDTLIERAYEQDLQPDLDSIDAVFESA